MARYLVTGADRGIGEAMCRQLAERGDEVIAACLGDGSVHQGRKNLRVEARLDVRKDESVAALAKRLEGVHLDVILNNAGVVHYAPLGEMRSDHLLDEFEVNTIGPLRVVQALLGCLGPGSKIGIVTSRVGSLQENQSGGLYGYRMSKAAANMLGLCLARDLVHRDIAVICLHPGTVRTEIVRGLPGAVMGTSVEPDQAAAGLIARMDELTVETTGTFRHANGETLPW